MKIARWLDSRLGLAGFIRRGMNHIFPDHWSFMLGEVALYSFVVLVLTGTFLALFFDASAAGVTYHGSYSALVGVPMSAAYRSVLDLSFNVPAGLLIRQIHHWAALVFIGAILAHLLRIFFTAAYRRPRELNWVIGLTLLLLGVGNGFIGYSIPDDLLSGTGLRIAYSLVLSIPLMGSWLAFLIFGGRVPNDAMIPRLYSIHIFLLPAMIVILMVVHLAVIWHQKHTNYPGPGRSNQSLVGSRLWPTYAAKAAGLFFLVFGILAALGGSLQINPIWVYGPYNPSDALPSAQPDWYLGWAEGALRLFPATNLRIAGRLIPEIFFPGVLLPLIFLVLLYAYPFIERRLIRDQEEHHVLRLPREQPLITALGCTVLMFFLVLFVAGSDDVIAVVTHSSVVKIRTLLRIFVLALPPVVGAISYGLCLMQRRRLNAPGAENAPEIRPR